MSSFLFINGIACLAAIWLAGHHSIEAKKCAISIFIGWILYVLSWSPVGFRPKDFIYWTSGDWVWPQQIWAFTDCIIGLYIARLTIPHWHGVVLWLTFTIQCFFHILSINQILDFAAYSGILDKIFIIQIAVFLVLGWPNVRDRVFSFVSRKWPSASMYAKGVLYRRERE